MNLSVHSSSNVAGYVPNGLDISSVVFQVVAVVGFNFLDFVIDLISLVANLLPNFSNRFKLVKFIIKVFNTIVFEFELLPIVNIVLPSLFHLQSL